MTSLIVNIGIDGPAGAGKGTITNALAQIFDYRFFDAGSTYRGVAYILNQRKVTPENFQPKDFENLIISYNDKGQVCIDDRCLEGLIRTPEVGTLAASFANHAKGYKPLILSWQKNFLSQSKGWIAEGRDIVPRVMPDAEVKIYFTADARERAKRRFEQFRVTDPEKTHDFDNILEGILARDEGDYSNEGAPLMRPRDANRELNPDSPYEFYVDSTKMTPETQTEIVASLIRKKIKSLQSTN